MSAITALRQSHCPTVALIAARSNFRKELLSGQPQRKRCKTCSGQELKMKNKIEPCVQTPTQEKNTRL